MSGKKDISEMLSSIYEEGRKTLTEVESKNVLSKWDIPVTETRLATSELEAVDAARDLKYPVVMKISSPDIIDKSEAECLRLGISSEIEVRQAFEDLKLNARSWNEEADIRGVAVQTYVPGAQEIVIGIIQDQSFGPTVTFGLSGVWVEVLKDISYRLAPVSKEDAKEMIKEINGYPILTGVNGGTPVDRDALVDIIQKTSELPMEFRQISEIELDPVFVYERGEGAIVVDARITLKNL